MREQLKVDKNSDYYGLADIEDDEPEEASPAQ